MRNDPVSFSRSEMVMVMHDQELEIERLRAKVEELQAQLDDYEIKFEEAGSLAEAAVSITRLFEAAQAAADIYLDNIQRKAERTEAILEDVERQADAIISDAEAVAKQHLEAAGVQSSAKSFPKPKKGGKK